MPLAEHVQAVALGALGDDPQGHLQAFRPALRTLRNAYRAGEAPNFGDPTVRGAYLFAYHPHHCVLAAEALEAVGRSVLGGEAHDVVRVTVLGAGPAPELVALAWLLRDSGVRIEADLVDREPGWEITRRTTVDATTASWPIEIQARHRTADLQHPDGLELVTALVRGADIVIAQAVLTELTDPAGGGQVLDHLMKHFGASTRLVVIDFDRVGRTRDATARLDAARNAIVLTTAQFDLPASEPAEVLRTHFYAAQDGLWPRRKLHCALRVLARPGARPFPPTDFSPTQDQAAALSSFRAFLTGNERVFVLRGTAGTGKTTLFPSLAQEAAAHGLPVVLLAPTGRAARRLGQVAGRPGSTIHSHLYRHAQTAPRGDEETPLTKFVLRDAPAEPAVYIVDEASLIGNSPDTSEEIATADVVFGEGRLLSDLLSTALAADDSRVVFVGDANQLPPVGEETSPALDLQKLAELTRSQPHCAELTEVVRQSGDSAILPLARAWFAAGTTPALCRHEPDAGINILQNSRVDPWLVHEIKELRAAVIAARNADVRTWNERIRERAGLAGAPPAPGEHLLVIRTDLMTGLFNGDEVEVAEAARDVEVVRLRNDEVRLRRARLALHTAAGPVVFETMLVDDLLPGASTADQRLVNRVLYVDFLMRSGLKPDAPGFADAYAADDRVHALRATYAYARTCHRAQGGEWDHAIVDFAGARAFGRDTGRWAYTALTRARKALHLLHTGEAAYDGDRLLDEASQHIAQYGMRVARHREIQGGVQLTIQRGDSQVNVDLYAKGGVPSNAKASGPDAGLHAVALTTLRQWIEDVRERRLPPLPERLETHAGRIAARLSLDGYDVNASPRAEYQVTFSAKAHNRSAEITYHHKATGELGTTLSQSASGDVTTLATLRTAIEATRG